MGGTTDFTEDTDGETAEGVRARLPLAGGVQSGLGYLGARDLSALRAKARYIRVSPAGQRESVPHDIIELKAKT